MKEGHYAIAEVHPMSDAEPDGNPSRLCVVKLSSVVPTPDRSDSFIAGHIIIPPTGTIKSSYGDDELAWAKDYGESVFHGRVDWIIYDLGPDYEPEVNTVNKYLDGSLHTQGSQADLINRFSKKKV